jgi:metal-responsive CopG/Arc/MetJ family transcriptional regulator
MAVNPKTTTRKLVSLPHAMVRAVEDFRFQRRIKTESEAIRRLIELGLNSVRRPVRNAKQRDATAE